MNARRRKDWGGTATSTMAGGSTINNKKSALSAAYAELGKELTSGKLRSIGTYTLGRPIGEGTFGKVRLGTHRLTATRVAIKQVPKAHSANLTREIHHHRRLHHPNVMQLYEVLATESCIWMVTELCAGGELYDYLVERGTMPEPEARRIFGQLCLAVAYIHDRGIVHRDLKLENVLLDERCNVKLGDFGFTREFEGKKLMETFCGTTGYAAPEMLAGRRYTGEEVDIWSLGVILYALVCGALPFDDDDEAVMKTKILQGQYELPDVLSDDCKDLISLILQQDPNARPSIKTILSHSWFTKYMAPIPMETVDEVANDAGASKSAVAATNESAIAEDDKGEDHLLIPAPKKMVASPAAIGGETREDDLSHKASASGLSEGSYFSALSKSDSESSDRRSSDTEATNPTTDEADQDGKSTKRENDTATSNGRGDDEDDDDAGSRRYRHAPTTALSWKHRNESQTTIKRQASAGSDASRKATSKSTSTPLPTHVESTGEPTFSEKEEADTDGVSSAHGSSGPAPALYSSFPLEQQRSSQSATRTGHHRTPSRTKRRSSGGLSDHHPPSLDVKPTNYMALLELSGAALFSTVVEQNLLHQLSMLGMDVGQIVHSVVNEACDASGAMWWILKKKAEERTSQQEEDASMYNGLYSNLPMPASAPMADTSSRSRKDSDLTSQHSQQHASSASASHNKAPQQGDLVRPTPVKAAEARPDKVDAISGPDAGMPRGFAESTRDASSMTHEGSSVVSHAQTTSNVHSNRPARPSVLTSPTRNRTNSFSARLSSVLAGKDKEQNRREYSGEPTIMIGNEQFLMEERSKSPVVSSIFSKKGTSTERSTPSPAGSPGRSPEKQKKKDAARSPLQHGTVASGDMSLALKSKELILDAQRSNPASPKRELDKAELAKALNLHQTKSFETFSTISSATHVDEANDSKTKSTGRKGKSSFLHTVRNWLGAEEKDKSNAPATSSGGGKNTTKGKRKKNRRSTQQLSSGSGTLKRPPSIHGGLQLASGGTLSRGGSIRRMHPPPSAYPVASMSRSPRIGPRSGSISRRSSSGSVQYANVPNLTSMQRPVSIRRQSAGSITPTATIAGGEDYVFNQVRSSRPSSAQSFHRPLPAGFTGGGLHAKSGSTGSSNSFARLPAHGSGYSGSLRGLHAHRPSTDGGTTVRKHRHYPSMHHQHARSDSGGISRPSTPGKMGPEEASLDTVTPRRSFDSSVGRASPMHTPRASQSVFVAHRSRTPYKPPSANSALMASAEHTHANGVEGGQFAHHSHAARPLYHYGVASHHPPLGTWRKSWGKPPPSWAGPVDSTPSAPSSALKRAGQSSASEERDGLPKLRDVFANRESDDDWEDEEDEPTYAGGLGQLASSSWGVEIGQPAKGAATSLATSMSTAKAGNETMPSSIFGSGRYAGVRGLFQPPSLGRETMPRSWIASAGDEASSANPVDGSSTGKMSYATSDATGEVGTGAIGGSINTGGPAGSATGTALAGEGAPSTASRVRSSAPAFKGPVTIEEEEEDE